MRAAEMGGGVPRARGSSPAPRSDPEASRPRRRTQAQRSASTREQVIQAVVDCIAEEGLVHTTAARIAARAGVTWGAIVHQFGDKDSLLLAVLERSFGNLSSSLSEAMAHGARSPRERVTLLVGETWSRLTAPSSQAFLEILLGTRAQASPALRARREEMTVQLTQRIWIDLFAEFGVAAETIDTVRKLTFATLLGLAILAMVGPRRPRFRRELQALEESILHSLGLDAKTPLVR